MTGRWRAHCPGGCKHTLERGRENTAPNEERVLNDAWESDLTSSSLTPAVLQRGVAIVTQFAALAGGTFAVVQAEQTLAAAGVAGVWVQHVDVVVTLAGLTPPARLCGVSVVTR